MKVLAIFLFFALANCQGPTVTEELLQAQNELTIGHEFSEIFLVQNREILSDYLMRIETIALDQFMGAYAVIKNRGIATREEMDQFEEPSFCKDAGIFKSVNFYSLMFKLYHKNFLVRARWELQVTRYGQRLSQCLGVTHAYA